MKIKIHTKVLFHRAWMQRNLLDQEGSTAQVPLGQSHPKRKNRPKMAFLIFLQSTFPEAFGELCSSWKCTIDWEDALEMWSANSSSGFVREIGGWVGGGGIHHIWQYWTWSFLFGKLFVFIKNSCDVPYVPAVKIVENSWLDLTVTVLQTVTKCNVSIHILEVWLRINH